MTSPIEKVQFASLEWLDLARGVLEELVAEHGEVGTSFSVCEVFTNAPSGTIGTDSDNAAWHFRIVGTQVTVGEGEIDGADMSITVDYSKALPMAKRVYPEFLGWLVVPLLRVISLFRGKPSAPAYLMDLHNRLALVTQ